MYHGKYPGTFIHRYLSLQTLRLYRYIPDVLIASTRLHYGFSLGGVCDGLFGSTTPIRICDIS